MGIFDKAILISDIDGTLLHDGIIPDANIDAIEYFKKEGGLFTVATGRGVVAARESYSLLKCNAPAAVFQGGAVYDYKNEEFIPWKPHVVGTAYSFTDEELQQIAQSKQNQGE